MNISSIKFLEEKFRLQACYHVDISTNTLQSFRTNHILLRSGCLGSLIFTPKKAGRTTKKSPQDKPINSLFGIVALNATLIYIKS